MGDLHVVHVLHSLGTGGMEKGVTTVVRNASPRVRHSVLCLSTSGPMAQRLPPHTPVVEMHKPPGNSSHFLWRLSRQLLEMDADVVHTRNWGGMDGIVAARLAGVRGVVHGEHGWDVGDVAGKKWRRRWVRKLLSRWVREFTCVSRDLERWLRDDLRIRRPVTQVYNGVDTDVFAPGEQPSPLRAELGLPAGAFVLGSVGRLDPIKDHPTLFRAVASLRERGLPAELLVVGDGPERERLEGLAGGGVHLLGDRRDVPELLRALDVFALTSQNEGLSNTILEAMASGLPVVATRVGGNPELVEDGRSGVLVDVGRPEALADALAAYVDLARRRAHGEAGRARVLERFSVRQMVDGYERVWMRVAGTAARRR